MVSDARQPEHPIIYANPHFSVITGYELPEILGHNCRFLQGPDTDQATVAAIRRAIGEQRVFRGEILNYRKDGMPFWNLLLLYPLNDTHGELEYYVGIQTDITEIKQREHDNQERIHTTRLANMATALAHDMSNLLAATNAAIDLAKRPSKAGSAAASLDLAASAIGRAQRISRQLLRYARNNTPDRFTTDIRQVLNDVRSTEQHLVHIVGAEDTVLVDGDRIQLEQVFGNLLSNAVNASPPEKPITFRISTNQGFAVIEVIDQGCGIPVDELTTIFEPFHSRRTKNGTGLGLAIAERIITSHNGTITVDSRVGEGSTFTVRLPLEQAPAK